MKILIKNAKILSMKGEEIFESDLLIEESVIKKIEKNIDCKADKTIDADGMLLMPGFVNCHTHVGMSLFRNYGPETDLMTWLNDYIWPLEDKLTGNEVYVASKLSFVEMVKNGISCFNDMYFFLDDTIKAANEVGIRGMVSRGLMTPDPDDLRIKENLDIYKKYKDSELIDVAFGPHAVYTSDFDYLSKIGKLAEDYSMPIHIHLSETKKENDDCIENFRMSPTEFLEKAGIFKNRTIAAHGVHLSDRDLDILSDNGVSIAHNPASNLKLSSGFMDLGKAMDKGVNVCLGTDSSASNNKLSILREMQLTALVSKLHSSREVSSYEILKMATINGAKALGLDDKIGTIEEGKLADLILIDLNNINHIPNNNLISSLIYSTYEEDIKYTIINGKVVYENARVNGINEGNLLAEAIDSSKNLGIL